MRPLLPALLLLIGCQSAPATPDTPTTPQPEQPAPATAAQSCCPTGTTEASAEACADGQCVTLTFESGPLLCRFDAPMEREPQPCDAFLGYAWSGADCRGVSGCNTTAQLYPSAEQCQQAHAHCKPAAP